MQARQILIGIRESHGMFNGSFLFFEPNFLDGCMHLMELKSLFGCLTLEKK